MLIFLLCLLTFQCPAEAKSMRTVHLGDADMEPVFVEPGYSTLLKFDSHPEPGLIGDQDRFKVEYMKNMVAIKPLVAKGKTNLFLFTKDGQFNFQLIAEKGHHDNIVYVQAGNQGEATRGGGGSAAVLVDNLLTRKINKSVSRDGTKLTLESISMPVSRTTLVLRFSLQSKNTISEKWFSVQRGTKIIPVENCFLEAKPSKAGPTTTTGLILIRALDLKDTLRLEFLEPGKKPLSISFSADFVRR